ncbi:unnamed protein product, partial [Leptidea sinapis]
FKFYLCKLSSLF